MTRIFLDTNVIIDLLAAREPFYDAIARLATLADLKQVTIIASPVSFTTAHYILSKFGSAEIAAEKIRKFKIICDVGIIDDGMIEKALNSGFRDFEDAVQYYCAIGSGSQVIITRNAKDFRTSEIPCMSADAFMKTLM